jgi:hypothetical protein
MDSFLVVVVGFVVGALSGALSAFLGWNKSGEPFDKRKFISGTITGIIAGIAFVIANITGLLEAATPTEQLIQMFVFVVAIIGVDSVRTAITGTIANRTEPAPTA